MKKIDTGSAPGNRLLDVLVGCVAGARPSLVQPWLAGDIEMDFNFRFLGARAGLGPDDVPTVLGFLHTAGYLEARMERNTCDCARVSLRLPGAELA